MCVGQCTHHRVQEASVAGARPGNGIIPGYFFAVLPFPWCITLVVCVYRGSVIWPQGDEGRKVFIKKAVFVY